jgi:hypothetical protein
MLKPVDLSFMDEPPEDPAELLRALPEIGHELAAAATDGDLGLRSLLEHPEGFTHPWWRDQASRSGSRFRPEHRSGPPRTAQIFEPR